MTREIDEKRGGGQRGLTAKEKSSDGFRQTCSRMRCDGASGKK